MPAVHYTNLLIVVTIGLLAPLALGFFPRFRLPAIVLELVLGILIGPSGLGWARADLPVSILALIGLAFLLFLSGLEIDVERLRGPVLKLTTIGFALSFAIAITLGLGLKAGGFVKSPLFVAIVLAASSVSVIFPVLKDANVASSRFGQLVRASASVAEFGAIILLSLFFSGKGSSSTTGTLILVGVFGLVVALVGVAIVALVGVAIAGAERSISLSHVLWRLEDTTAQIRVRAAFVLMIGFAALADQFGLETILGAFAAGVLLSLIDRDQTTHPEFRLKLEAAAFGVFIPVFFVTSGLRFNLNALFASPSTVARVPLFLLAIYLARGLPAIVVRATARPLALGDRRRASSHLPDGHRRRHPNRAPTRRDQPGQRRGTRRRRSSLGGDLPGPRTRAAPPRTARKSFKAIGATRTAAHASTPRFNTGITFVSRRLATRTIASAPFRPTVGSRCRTPPRPGWAYPGLS